MILGSIALAPTGLLSAVADAGRLVGAEGRPAALAIWLSMAAGLKQVLIGRPSWSCRSSCQHSSRGAPANMSGFALGGLATIVAGMVADWASLRPVG
ncbi:hypothetical protein ACVSQB_14945 [Bradyrhizobium elkanii]